MAGRIVLSTVPGTGVRTLLGSAVNFAFRLEQCGGSLGLTLVASEAAAGKLAPHLVLRKVEGCITLKGFAETATVFTL